MIEFTLSVVKSAVYTEVAKTTDYNGSKSDDVTRRDKVATQDEDDEMLDRFWDETCATATQSMKQFIKGFEEGLRVFRPAAVSPIVQTQAQTTAATPSLPTRLPGLTLGDFKPGVGSLADLGDISLPSIGDLSGQTEHTLKIAGYYPKMGMSDSFDSTLEESIQKSLFSFFVASIISKWMTFSVKAEAAEYAQYAASMLDDVLRKLYFKKKPKRPTYND